MGAKTLFQNRRTIVLDHLKLNMTKAVECFEMATLDAVWVLSLGHNGLMQQYRPGEERLESHQQKRSQGCWSQPAEQEPAVCPGGQGGQQHMACVR